MVVPAVSSDVSSVAEYSKTGAKAYSFTLEQDEDGMSRIQKASARLGGNPRTFCAFKDN